MTEQRRLAAELAKAHADACEDCREDGSEITVEIGGRSHTESHRFDVPSSQKEQTCITTP